MVSSSTSSGGGSGGSIGNGCDPGDGQQDGLRTSLQRNLPDPPDGVLPQADHRGGSLPLGSASLHHAVSRQRCDSRDGVVGQHAGIPGRPARRQLSSVEQGRENQRRANRPHDLGDIVVLGEILTHQADEGQFLSEFNELHRPASDVHRFPPEDVRVEGTTQVILEDL